MARLARFLVLASAVAGSMVLLVASGCGFDGIGLLDGTGGSSVQVGTDASSADAAGDVVDEPVTLEVGVVVEGGPPLPGPCDDPAIVLCLRFDGSAVDGAHAQAVGVAGTVSYVAGVDGKAALLDVSSAVTVPDGPAWKYTALTVEMWARPDALPAGGGRAGLLDKDLSFGVFAYSDGTVGCIMNQTASGKAFSTIGTWVHVACVNDGASTTLYVDGVSKTVVSASTVSTTTALAAIGNNSPNLGNPWIGALDTVRVYARAKTAAQIADDARR